MSRLFPEHVQKYFDSLIESDKKPATVKQYTSDLDKFLVWIESYKGATDLNTLRSLQRSDIENYIHHLQESKHSAATIRRLFSVLKGYLTFLNITITFNIKDTGVESLRELDANDFISEKELNALLKSMKTKFNSDTPLAAARDYLIDRNVSIVFLMRFYGMTPTEISSINMESVNFAHNSIKLSSKYGERKIVFSDDHKKHLLLYFNSIPKAFRPRYNSKDPLFVAFNNVSTSFQYDYVAGMPKKLSVRGIQKMIKMEVGHADLRKLSAANMRNSCILDDLKANIPDEIIVTKYNLTTAFSLHRYKKYIKAQKPS